ncbi:MAG: hypothetical protein ACRBB6_03970 [Neptuniibacter sp.]
MTTTSDPWSAANDDQTTSEINNFSFAPFALLSCKKAYESRELCRKKLHLIIYSIVAICYCALTLYYIWVFLSEPSLFNRSDLLFLISELLIVAWMFKLVLEAKGQAAFFHYRFHLFVITLTRSNLWALVIAVPIFIWAILKPNLGLFAWYSDDLWMLWYCFYLVLLIQGARYFRKDKAHV